MIQKNAGDSDFSEEELTVASPAFKRMSLQPLELSHFAKHCRDTQVLVTITTLFVGYLLQFLHRKICYLPHFFLQLLLVREMKCVVCYHCRGKAS